MSDERPNEYFVEKGAKEFTCCYCECLPESHACGWNCLIFKDNPICSQCCLVDSLRKDATKVFSDKLGCVITRDSINELCHECGRNNAIEDEALADQLQNNSFKPANGDSK